MAPRAGIAIREIVYQLSPYQQDILKQTFKNAPNTFMTFLKEKGPGLTIMLTTYFAGKTYVEYGLEQEKMAARY